MTRPLSVWILSITCTLAATTAHTSELDPRLFPYQKASGEVTGSLKCVGSDTMNNLVALWAEDFKKFYPSVQEGIEGKGSSSGPPALTEGLSIFSPMSREWKPSEIDVFKQKHGYAPTVLLTAIDMVAIYVHKDNPLEKISLPQLDAIYSKNRNGGIRSDIRTWGDLGLEGEWKEKPISLYGRNASSGTYGFFKNHALFKGDFKATVKEQPGSSSVVKAISNDRFSIGYSGIGYKTPEVRAVPLAWTARDKAIPVEPVYAYRGEYPLGRFLYISVNHEPGSLLDPLRREFLRYILSADGQAIVQRDGYLPITANIAEQDIKKVNLN